MKPERIARALLILAGVFFVMGWMMACYCPGEFLLVAGFCLLPICAGGKLVRPIGILICGAALLSASHMYLKDELLKEKVQRIRSRHLQQKKTEPKNEPPKPLASGSQRGIVHAA